MKRVKLTNREKALFALPFLVLLVPLASALKPGDERLEEAMRQLSGPGATDCDEKGTSASINECMVSHFKSRKPFRAHLKTRNEPDRIIGVVMTPQGKLYDLMWQRGSWLSPGRITGVFRVHRVVRNYDGTYGQAGHTELTSAQQDKLFQE
jgi:hypothetical protein